MGCGKSAPIHLQAHDDSAKGAAVWRVIPDDGELRRKFLLDNSVSPACTGAMLEFRFLLDEPLAVAHMSAFAERSSAQMAALMSLWRRVLDMKASNMFNLAAYLGLLGEALKVMKGQRLYQEAELRVLYNQQPRLYSSFFCHSMRTVANEDFQCLQRLLVEVLYDEMFVPFSCSSDNDNMRAQLGRAYNCVGADDFDYVNVIAEGGFGLVLQGTRKSTGINYAIKVQPKAHLLKHFRRNPANVMLEMQAHACCRHPFVTKLAYAFCTETLAVLVLPLAACGDLRRSLSLIPGGCMPFDRVQFYTAEIVSALCYLHSHDILYRDLKPGNILLNSDGHVLLSDFGSVADQDSALCYDGSDISITENGTMMHNNRVSQRSVSGNEDDMCSRSDSTSLILNRGSSSRRSLAHFYGQASKPQVLLPSNSIHSTTSQMGVLMQLAGSETNSLQISITKPVTAVSSNSRARNTRDVSPGEGLSDDRSNSFMSDAHTFSKRRSKSLVGTLAYMAPEIVAMFGKKRRAKEKGEDPFSGGENDSTEGYTSAVDWWSMGVTVYKLLTGLEPFRVVPYDKLHRYFPALVEKMGGLEAAFTAIFGSVNFLYCDAHVPTAAVDLITQFLVIDPCKRLGSNRFDENGELLGGGGVAEITKHAFFDGIDWDKLEKKQLKPPFDPSDEATFAPSSFYGMRKNSSSNMRRGSNTLPRMLNMCNKANWLQTSPPEDPAEPLRKASPNLMPNDDNSGGQHARDKIAAVENAGEGMEPIRIPASSILCAPAAKPVPAGSSMYVPPDQQDYFQGWSFVDPDVVALEARIAAIMAKL